MKISQVVAIAILAVGIPLAAQAAVTASLDRSEVGSGEGVQLLLERDGSSNNPPDLTPLAQDFSVLGTGTGSSVQIVNGHVSSTAQIRISMVPKHDGKLQVPSLEWDGQRSQTLVLTVGGTSAPGTPGVSGQGSTVAQPDSSHVFMDTKLNPSQVFVDQAVLLTVRLHTDTPLQQAGLDLVGNRDVKVQPIGEDKQSSESRNGRDYQVVERRYVLFPQRSGVLQLDGPVLQAQVVDAARADPFGGDPFFGNVFARLPFAGTMNALRPLRLQGKPIALTVQPRPAGVAAQDWLPATAIDLEETWLPAAATVHAGEPITRHLRLHAQGITAGQLPDLSAAMSLPEGIKAYPDPAKLDTQLGAEGLTASRDQDIALIASRPGHYDLPPMRVSWWDAKQNTTRVLTVPGRTLDVLPAVAGTNATPEAPSSTTSDGTLKDVPTGGRLLNFGQGFNAKAHAWFWVSAGLFVAFLGAMAAWWRERKRAPRGARGPIPHTGPSVVPKTGNVSTSMQAFIAAAQANDAPAARRHLLVWASKKWPQDPPSGLQALAQRLQQSEFDALLKQLDRACFSNGEWQGSPLVLALKTWRQSAAKEVKIDEIAGLYR